MTGFGRAEHSTDINKFSVEVKTVNHRYKDIYINMPNHLRILEDKIKKLIDKYILRGRVEVYIKLDYGEEYLPNIAYNPNLADSYYKSLSDLKNRFSIKQEINLDHLLEFKDIFEIEEEDLDEDELWADLKLPLEVALKELKAMRLREGEILYESIKGYLSELKTLLERIEEDSQLVVEESKIKLEERISLILADDFSVDQEKLANEVALIADRSDITEEIARLKAHINQFEETMTNQEAIGRKLDFIIQEMNREINTIGSKSSHVDISKNVVEFKALLEKTREQIQNIQ